jgi:hypothetical protein
MGGRGRRPRVAWSTRVVTDRGSARSANPVEVPVRATSLLASTSVRSQWVASVNVTTTQIGVTGSAV